MEVKLPEKLIEAIDIKNLKKFDITEDSLTWQRYAEISLNRITLKEVKEIQKLCEPYKDIRGTKMLLYDIKTWIDSVEGTKSPRIRKLEHFESLLIDYVARVDGHRLFKKHDKDGEAWLCFYISEIDYHPAEKGSYGYTPAYVHMDCIYERFGKREEKTVSFYTDDVRGYRIEEALARKGFYSENDERRSQYLKELASYKKIAHQIGKQYTVVGIGTNDVPTDESRYHITIFSLGNSENLNRVVVDVFNEDSKDSDNRHTARINSWFWRDKIKAIKARGEKEVDDDDPTLDKEYVKKNKKDYHSGTRRGLPIEDVDEDPPTLEIPVHTFIVAFDLQKHIRLSIHVKYFTEYTYDTSMSEKLILPKHMKVLINMLVENTTRFKDIVSGKGGGTIVLLTGLPGVGKTLTAEIYAEAEKRPLYSVQASQLGTDPDELETRLMKVLNRSSRWGAILLIDEADVYVHERGNSLAQNAIVGVFLRVLEYHASTLFLTTNRPDLVDDAIASRCVARIDYEYPIIEDQKKIWRILSDISSIDIKDSVISEFAESHPNTSGRDVKNLLKLASLISSAKKIPINLKMLNYVLKFKPTTLKNDKGEAVVKK